MAQKKAYVRYAQNKAVPGSLIVRTKAPKVGTWKEVPYDICCGAGDQVLCFTSTTALPPSQQIWSIVGRKFDDVNENYGFILPNLFGTTTNEEWVEMATEAYSWMGMSFLVNSEDPSKVDICMKESLLKSIFPAEDGSTFNFVVASPA
jgi:hypothetical protein